MGTALTRSQERLTREELSRLKRGQFLTSYEKENRDQLIESLEQQLKEETLPDR